MNKISITLKARHFRVIAALLQSRTASEVFRILHELTEHCTDNLTGDTDVTVEAYPDELLNVYSTLSNQPEGIYAALNSEMKEILAPQIAAGVSAESVEWVYVAEQLQKANSYNTQALNRIIEQGSTLLKG